MWIHTYRRELEAIRKLERKTEVYEKIGNITSKLTWLLLGLTMNHLLELLPLLLR